MRRSFVIPLFLVLPLLAAGTACTTIPETHYYLLRLKDKALPDASRDPGGLRIGVEDFRVDPPYDQDRIVYRIGSEGTELGFYAYHRWAVPLSRMLPQAAAGRFAGTPGIRSIEPVVQNRNYAAILEGRILSIEEIDTQQGQQVSIELTLWLRHRDGTLIWSDTLAAQASTKTGSVATIVERMRDTLILILAEGRERLSSALRTAR